MDLLKRFLGGADKLAGKAYNGVKRSLGGTIDGPVSADLAGIPAGLRRGKDFVGNVEALARPIFTGKGLKTDAADAWFPNLNKPVGTGKGQLGEFDIKRAGLSMRAVGTLGVGYGAVAGSVGLLNSTAQFTPPASLYSDGRNIRHYQDNGVTSDYGRSVMGKHSNMNNQAASR
jgi:hypothetical protein